MSVATRDQQPLERLDIFDGARVAVVHEWVAARAGSEKVFETFAQLFPLADLYALTVTPGVKLAVGGRPIHTTWLDRWDHLRESRWLTLPLMPLAWATMRRTYDIVITSSHAFARTFPSARKALHFSYVHTPARYLWTPEIDGREAPRYARPAAAALRSLDQRTAQHTHAFAANSNETAQRIRRFYGRDSTLIFPPVDTSRFLRGRSGARRGLLCFGRWVDYKRFDIAIRAAHLANERLTVAGQGPQEKKLRELAGQLGADTHFVRSPSDPEVVDLFHRHRALLFPGHEDFGIVPVEAAAAGLPTIAYRAGGAIDTVVPGVNGWLVGSQTAEDFEQRIRSSRATALAADAMRRHAKRFSPQEFRERVEAWLRTGLLQYERVHGRVRVPLGGDVESS